jgi:hypothetical protein
MKITIGAKTYTAIKNLSFAPETDVTGSSVPINEYTVDIVTSDTISTGQYALLYDDRDGLWARYWITDADRVDPGTVRVKAASFLFLLDRRELGGKMYAAASLSSVLSDVFGSLPVTYAIDSALQSAAVTGWCPQQSARERLQSVCFVLGAYLKTFFTDKDLEIKVRDTGNTLIPLDKTYWRPSLRASDVVTGLKVTAFSFEQKAPEATDEYVTDGDYWYVVTRQDFTLANSNAPSGAAENVVTVDNCMLVNSGNVSAVLSQMAQWYFNRTEIELDAINNADFVPGQKVFAYTDETTIEQGYMDSATFTFGLQAKSRIHIVSVETQTGATLTINYKYDDTLVGQAVYTFPVGYAYTVANPFVDWTANGHRYVFRPENQNATGTMASGSNVNNQPYDVALHCYENILHVISVSDIQEQSEGKVRIG